MIKYPSVTFPAIYYTMGWTYINTMPAITLATIYTKAYGFTSGQIGLALGTSLIVGSVIAETFAGRVSDWIMRKDAQRHGGVRRPESRLYLLWLSALFMPGGLIIFGFCLQESTPWIAPLVGVAIGSYYNTLLLDG